MEKQTAHFDFLKGDIPGKPKGWHEMMISQAMDAGQAVVAHIGGSGGHDAMVLAQDFPNLKLIVQNRLEQHDAFEHTISTDLKTRVTFQKPDFFSVRPMRNASFRILRVVVHDWSDQKAVEVFLNASSVIHIQAYMRP
ncbi:hypothetical protein LX32DRAFT_700540 [Colletotrichum zoysiae]|uniref:O-methyltransferase C-terminal domain-containing protein n=1 Tax=Colletotrichum zoysiae TaxID=1216348 RepID=A0AAD9M6U8_9PEZI|nr:hypothetical protein LX32DRAFT_700540 [Colletotrichum zoysiae]